MAATFRGERQDVESGDSPFDLSTTDAARSRSRLPEMLIGTLLVALFALGGAWFYSTSTTRTAYLALRQPVERGQVIERNDLTVYELTTDAPILALRTSQLSEVVGKVSLADLSIGTLITAEQFADAADIPSGSGIVGLDLEPGEFSSYSLRVGDRVRILRVPTGSSSVEEPLVLAESAEIVEFIEGSGRGRFIALVLDVEVADQVALAAAQGEVRLIQVTGG
ncbi:MAG: SAF domain-containing protein [Actinomycetota bacterium]